MPWLATPSEGDDIVGDYRAQGLTLGRHPLAPLLGVYGIWQRQGEVRHLVAKRLVDMSALLGRLDTHSRDFC
jgi:hypothetical protein